MKETIEYYYNLDIENIDEQEGRYHFKINNDDFFFVFYNRGIDELDDILNISNEMLKKGIDVHKILKNINGSHLTKINDYNYILFSVYNPLQEFDIFDMLDFTNTLELNVNNTKLYRNNWSILWSSKVDYFEEQKNELHITKDIIKNSFSYYIGLAENAISYVNNTNYKYDKLNNSRVVLSHRRVFFPNYKLNYLNPLSFIIDLRVRDIAEYLKYMFFKKEEEAFQELQSYLKVSNLNIYECHMLMARLLYPTYYFDIYESVINKDDDEEKLVDIIKKSSEYEDFLKKAYLEISKYAKLEKIDWLIDQR